MKIYSIRTRMLAAFFIIIGIFSVAVALFGAYEINSNIVGRAQKQLSNDLKAAEKFYDGEMEKIKDVFSLVPLPASAAGMEELKRKIGLDYLYMVDSGDMGRTRSDIVREAFKTGKSLGGTRIIEKDELLKMDAALLARARTDIKFTRMSSPTTMQTLESAMAIGYARPVAFDASGRVTRVMYGGKIINRDFELVDRIKDFVFEKSLYNGKPVGAVTIFQGDVRVATNVLDKDGKRALGTRVSKSVYDKVFGKGERWFDRAFVVTDWYLTAYEPIRDINGKTIGILYVGLLETPFNEMKRNILLLFVGIVFAAAGLAALLAVLLSSTITKPIDRMLEATGKISEGDLETRVVTKTPIKELNKFAREFNLMAQSLGERDRNLKELNKKYLDLIGFVSHELKGILSSTLLNAYSLRDGFLGMINFKQRKALDAVSRNLDYFNATIRNFLDLSRIEKGELNVHRTELQLKESAIDPAIEEFAKPAEEKGLRFVIDTEQGLKISADPDLIRIVFNNLAGNAVKYSEQGGSVFIGAKREGEKVRVEVYNDGRPVTEEEKARLFRRFSRLEAPETKKNKGTGLGLFITREIIEKHGGKIWVEPRTNGNSFIFEI